MCCLFTNGEEFAYIFHENVCCVWTQTYLGKYTIYWESTLSRSRSWYINISTRQTEKEKREEENHWTLVFCISVSRYCLKCFVSLCSCVYSIYKGIMDYFETWTVHTPLARPRNIHWHCMLSYNRISSYTYIESNKRRSYESLTRVIWCGSVPSLHTTDHVYYEMDRVDGLDRICRKYNSLHASEASDTTRERILLYQTRIWIE